MFTGQPVRDHEEHAVTQQEKVLARLRVQTLKTKTKKLTDKTTAELITLSVHDEQVSLVFDRRADNERKKKKKKKKTKNKIDEWYTGTYCVLV